jgi:hypothetical protein
VKHSAVVALAERLRRAIARTGRGPLEPFWALAYELSARVAAAYVTRGHAGAAAYATSSLATGEILAGVSDLDLAVVVPAGERPGAARARVESRRARLWRVLGPLGRHVWIAPYEDAELAAAQSPCLTLAPGSERTLYFGPSPLVDELELTTRPGMPGRLHTWRRLSGPERRPPLRTRSRDEDRVAAWLELQSWWRWAFEACLAPGTPGRAALCVKLVAEPCRILLWLVHGEEARSRRRALERALEQLPEESAAIERALALQRALPRSPVAPLAETLPVFVRLTARIARLLQAETDTAGATEVVLQWGGAEELALGPDTRPALHALLGSEPDLLPLVDWRSLVNPTLPDECFAIAPGDPADHAVLARAARASTSVAYAALRRDELLVLPTRDVYWLGQNRTVHFPASDPVSFALAAGEPVARFPDVGGWSIEDVSARAVVEHRGWLEVQLHEPGWDVQKLGRLLAAARAALLAESVAAGGPALPLTVAATARALAERDPAARQIAERAAEEYSGHRLVGGEPLDRVVGDLHAVVASLPPYRASVPVAASSPTPSRTTSSSSSRVG